MSEQNLNPEQVDNPPTNPLNDDTLSPEVPEADPADIQQERELPPDPRDGSDQQPEDALGLEQNPETADLPGDTGPRDIDEPGQNAGETGRPATDENPPL